MAEDPARYRVEIEMMAVLPALRNQDMDVVDMDTEDDADHHLNLVDNMNKDYCHYCTLEDILENDSTDYDVDTD